MRSNFFIFCTRERNFRGCREHLLYGAKLSRPDHRALANVKQGDMCFLYVMDERTLYGVFKVKDRIFEDSTDIGWDGDWPHRFPIRLWDSYLGIIDKKTMPQLMTFLSREMITIKDIAELHRKYLNPLLYNEGIKLLKFFIKNCSRTKPTEVFPDFGRNPIVKPPIDARSFLTSNVGEHILELYLLQNLDKLGEIAGNNFSEVYNQIYGYQNRFLDILTIHKHGEEVIKATVVEIKTNPGELDKGLEELVHYMYWTNDKIARDPTITFGILLTPFAEDLDIKVFKEKAKERSEFYGIESKQINWIGYEIKDRELFFTPIV